MVALCLAPRAAADDEAHIPWVPFVRKTSYGQVPLAVLLNIGSSIRVARPHRVSNVFPSASQRAIRVRALEAAHLGELELLLRAEHSRRVVEAERAHRVARSFFIIGDPDDTDVADGTFMFFV